MKHCADGIVLVKVAPELFLSGVALIGSEAHLALALSAIKDLPEADQLDVRHSIELAEGKAW